MDAIKQIQERREQLYNQLKDELEITKPEEFKYYETISEFKEIIEQLSNLRDEELYVLSCKK